MNEEILVTIAHTETLTFTPLSLINLPVLIRRTRQFLNLGCWVEHVFFISLLQILIEHFVSKHYRSFYGV